MKNPWLDIPLDDYEAHMALPHVCQASLLADLLGSAIAEYKPRSVAILGCAGGNGLERISDTSVQRVVGIDINPNYAESTRARFEHRIPRLELFVGDIQTTDLPFAPVELVFAGLFFEYVDVDIVVERIHHMLRPDGVLLAVLQLPGPVPEVTPSPYVSLGALSSVMYFVPPGRLVVLAEQCGFHAGEPRTVRAAGEKRFHVQAFTASVPSP
jgi:SAM-dependent methyltransferase